MCSKVLNLRCKKRHLISSGQNLMSWFWAVLRKIQSPWIRFLIFSAPITPASYFNGGGSINWTRLITEWTYSTFNTHHCTERTVIALVHLRFFLSSEINCSEINIIRMCSTYFAMDNKMIKKYMPSVEHGTHATLSKQSLNLK